LKGGEPSFLQFLEFLGVAVQLFVLIGVHRWLVAFGNYPRSSIRNGKKTERFGLDPVEPNSGRM
jgi:hypothetical protein